MSANVTVYLYQKDGTPFVQPGQSSDFTPGTSITIPAGSTVQYFQAFGYGTSSLSCGTRPAYGKIVVNSNGPLLMANGEIDSLEISSTSLPALEMTSQITVNGGQPF